MRCRSSRARSVRAWTATCVAMIAAVGVGGAMWLSGRRGRGSPAPARAAVAAATSQATRPATSTAPAEKWLPPRFAARRGERDVMVKTIRAYGLKDEAVLAAMAAVPRHEFVPKNLQSSAYADSPLPIGYGQTISQPYIVAEMTRQLKLTPESRVLEIGTGSGYQAAVLTQLYGGRRPRVYSMEIIKPLAEAARPRLDRLGYGVVDVKQADGYLGWPEKAPFDAIIVTCAAGQVPPPLIKQLAPGGRMVIPVGGAFSVQSLVLVTKDADGTVRSRDLMAVRFVPLIRQGAPGE